MLHFDLASTPKSVTDQRLTVHAMALSAQDPGCDFVVVSNDKDFVPLITKLRDVGHRVFVALGNPTQGLLEAASGSVDVGFRTLPGQASARQHGAQPAPEQARQLAQPDPYFEQAEQGAYAAPAQPQQPGPMYAPPQSVQPPQQAPPAGQSAPPPWHSPPQPYMAPPQAQAQPFMRPGPPEQWQQPPSPYPNPPHWPPQQPLAPQVPYNAQGQAQQPAAPGTGSPDGMYYQPSGNGAVPPSTNGHRLPSGGVVGTSPQPQQPAQRPTEPSANGTATLARERTASADAAAAVPSSAASLQGAARSKAFRAKCAELSDLLSACSGEVFSVRALRVVIVC